jgi:hypothetical protein
MTTLLEPGKWRRRRHNILLRSSAVGEEEE